MTTSITMAHYQLAQTYGTPLWVYQGDTISERIAQLKSFDVVRFAQKACSNIHILRLMKAQGVKVDSVSLGEIERALVAGYQGGREKVRLFLLRIYWMKEPLNV